MYKYMGLSQSNIYSRLYICISNPDIHENIYERDKNIFIPHIESPAIFTPLDILNAQRRNALRLIKRRLVGVLIGKRCNDEEVILSIVQNVKLETIIEIDETYEI